MEVTDFIQDKRAVALFRPNHNTYLEKHTAIFDYFLIFSFLLISSAMIVLLPDVINKRFSTIVIDEISGKNHLIPSLSIFKNQSQSIELSAQEERLAEFIDQNIINQVTYNINNSDLLAKQIVKASRTAGEDPLFVAAVVFSESSFRRNVRSRVGALGLMQIMPRTGEYIAEKIDHSYKGKASLTNPEENLKLGIAYIQYLKKMFKNDTHKVLLAYNWGPGNVSKGKRPPSVSINYSNKIQRLNAKWRSEFDSGYTATNLLALNRL